MIINTMKLIKMLRQKNYVPIYTLARISFYIQDLRIHADVFVWLMEKLIEDQRNKEWKKAAVTER